MTWDHSWDYLTSQDDKSLDAFGLSAKSRTLVTSAEAEPLQAGHLEPSQRAIGNLRTRTYSLPVELEEAKLIKNGLKGAQSFPAHSTFISIGKISSVHTFGSLDLCSKIDSRVENPSRRFSADGILLSSSSSWYWPGDVWTSHGEAKCVLRFVSLTKESVH
jgi:hypothetical protein